MGAYNKPDLISQGVGSVKYLTPWYPEGLRVAVFGVNAHLVKDPVRLTRWYMDEKVVVDFEPDPRDERWYIDEKRRWCVEQGIAYVPIYLADQLTLDQFASRLHEARQLCASGLEAFVRDQAVQRTLKQDQFKNDPQVALWIAKEALRRVEAQIAGGKRWTGVVKQAKLVAEVATIERELRERYPDGCVGPDHRASVAPHAAGG